MFAKDGRMTISLQISMSEICTPNFPNNNARILDKVVAVVVVGKQPEDIERCADDTTRAIKALLEIVQLNLWE